MGKQVAHPTRLDCFASTRYENLLCRHSRESGNQVDFDFFVSFKFKMDSRFRVNDGVWVYYFVGWVSVA